jgi:hypothetical protein
MKTLRNLSLRVKRREGLMIPTIGRPEPPLNGWRNGNSRARSPSLVRVRALIAAALAAALLAAAAALFYERRAPEAVQACRCGGGAAIYVSPKGSDAWSGRLPEPSPDGRDGPLATLEKALEVARRLKAEAGGPVRIVLRGGVYRVERPVVLGPEDSGCSGCPLVIEAYPGEVPVISGGKPVSGFEEVAVNGVRAWAARVPAGWRFKQLFVNGERRYRARLPKEGFYKGGGGPGLQGAEAGGARAVRGG